MKNIEEKSNPILPILFNSKRALWRKRSLNLNTPPFPAAKCEVMIGVLGLTYGVTKYPDVSYENATPPATPFPLSLSASES